jgi:hypothetical protein
VANFGHIEIQTLAENKGLSYLIRILAPQTFFLAIILSTFSITTFYLKRLWHGWKILW